MKQIFLALFLILSVTSGHTQGLIIKSYPSAVLYDSLVFVKTGDVIYIQGPSIKPLSGMHSYRYVYPDNFTKFPTRVQGIGGTKTYKTVIEELITFGDNPPIYAKVKDVNSDVELYVEIVSALRMNEAVPELPATLSRFKMFQLYLKQTKVTSDNLAIAYMNAFDRPTHKLDEFEQRAAIGRAKLICDSLRNVSLPAGHYMCAGAFQLGEYDFQKQQFLLPDLDTEKSYNLDLDKDIKDCILKLANISESLTLPINEKDAQGVANYYKEKNLPRNVYYYYIFDLTTTNVQSVITTNVMGSPELTKYFVQKAKVSSVHLFADPYFFYSIAEKNL